MHSVTRLTARLKELRAPASEPVGEEPKQGQWPGLLEGWPPLVPWWHQVSRLGKLPDVHPSLYKPSAQPARRSLTVMQESSCRLVLVRWGVREGSWILCGGWEVAVPGRARDQVLQPRMSPSVL